MREVTKQGAGERLLGSFELGLEKWPLAFAKDLSSPKRIGESAARERGAGKREVATARKALGLNGKAKGVSCYEAGRDGFWLHRWLGSQGEREPSRGLREQRGEPPAAAGEDGPDRCEQVGDDIGPLCQQGAHGVERGTGTKRGERGCTACPAGTGHTEEGADAAEELGMPRLRHRATPRANVPGCVVSVSCKAFTAAGMRPTSTFCVTE